MANELVGRKTARYLVADYLREEILHGRLEPGEPLAVGQLAERLGVSHTPVREAFQSLAAEGLVKISEYRSARVAQLSADEYEELMLMLIPLESFAARLGAEKADDGLADALRRQLELMREADETGNLDWFVELDRDFHRLHYAAAGRVSLWERIMSLRNATERYTRLRYALPAVDLHHTIKSHTEIAAAVAKRDGNEAARLIRADMALSTKHILPQLGGDPEAAFGSQRA